jgi:hypothetical protein
MGTDRSAPVAEQRASAGNPRFEAHLLPESGQACSGTPLT